jgi:hypothetical protein
LTGSTSLFPSNNDTRDVVGHIDVVSGAFTYNLAVPKSKEQQVEAPAAFMLGELLAAPLPVLLALCCATLELGVGEADLLAARVAAMNEADVCIGPPFRGSMLPLPSAP